MAMDILTQQNDPTQSASSISPQEQGTAAGTDNSQPEGTLPETDWGTNVFCFKGRL